MAAGDFSPSYMPDVLVKQQEMWAAGRSDRDLNHPEVGLQGVLSRQQVTFAEILRGDQCVGFKAAWLKSSANTVTDNSDSESNIEDCDLSGVEMESDSQTYAPNVFLRTSFMVTDDECKDLFTAQEKIARGMLDAKTKLKKTLSEKLVAFLNSNASASDFTIAKGAIHHTLDGVVHEIAPSDWNSDLLAEFQLHSDYNDLQSPYMLTGMNFWKDFWLTPYRTDFAKDKAQNVYQQGPFDIIFDPRNVDSVNDPAKRTYLIDAGALGWFSKNYNLSVTPDEIANDVYRYQESDMSLTFQNGGQSLPLTYDVYMKKGCYIKNGKARVPGWTFEVNLMGGLHVAPPDANDKNGIFAFDQIEAEAS